jgi:hypothetical protein
MHHWQPVAWKFRLSKIDCIMSTMTDHTSPPRLSNMDMIRIGMMHHLTDAAPVRPLADKDTRLLRASHRYKKVFKMLDYSVILTLLWDFKFSRRRVWCSELFSGLYCRVEWHGSITQKTALNISHFCLPDKTSLHLVILKASYLTWTRQHAITNR